MRKIVTVAGALAGLVYTGLGMASSYRHATAPLDYRQIAMEFLILAVFTVPLGASVGLGVGLLLEGLLAKLGIGTAQAPAAVKPK